MTRGLHLLAFLASAAVGCQTLKLRDGVASRDLVVSRQLSQEGISAMQRGEWPAAHDLCQRAVTACPENTEAHRLLAEVLWTRGKQAEALAEMERAVGQTPDDAQAHVRLAEMRLDAGDSQAALMEIDQALDLNPRLAAAWGLRGRVQFRSGRTTEALADYHRALGFEPRNTQWLSELADAYARNDEPRRVVAHLQALLDAYPPGKEPADVYVRLGQAYGALRRPQAAADAYATALERNPPTADILALWGQSQLDLGRGDLAERATTEALRMDPAHVPSRQLHERIVVARGDGTNALRR